MKDIGSEGIYLIKLIDKNKNTIEVKKVILTN